MVRFFSRFCARHFGLFYPISTLLSWESILRVSQLLGVYWIAINFFIACLHLVSEFHRHCYHTSKSVPLSFLLYTSCFDWQFDESYYCIRSSSSRDSIPTSKVLHSAFAQIFSIRIYMLLFSWFLLKNYWLSRIFAFDYTRVDKIGGSLWWKIHCFEAILPLPWIFRKVCSLFLVKLTECLVILWPNRWQLTSSSCWQSGQ